MKCSWCGKETGGETAYCRECLKGLIAEHLENATIARNEYAFVKALEECNEILQLDSNNLEAINLKEEIGDLTRMIEGNRKLSEEAFKHNDFEKALFYLDKILQLNPADEDALRRKEMMRVLVKVDADRFGLKSEEDLEKNGKKSSKKTKKYIPILTVILVIVVALAGLDRLYRWYNEREQAKHIYQSIKRKINTHDYQTALFLDEFEELMEAYDDTAYGKRAKAELYELYKRAKTNFETEIGAYMSTARMYFNQGEYSKAIGEWGRVLALDPENTKVKEMIKVAQNKMIFTQGISSARESRQDTYKSLVEKARELESKNQFAEAIEVYREATNYNLDDTSALDRVNFLTRKLQAQKEDAQQAEEISREKREASGPEQKGQKKPFVQKDQMTSLRPTSETQYHIPPPKARIHLIKGQTYFDRGEYALAMEEWRKAAKLDPQKRDFINTIIRKVERIIEKENKGYYLWYKKGLEYEQEEQWVSAIKAYQTALRFKPNDSVVMEKIEALAAIKYSSKSDGGGDRLFSRETVQEIGLKLMEFKKAPEMPTLEKQPGQNTPKEKEAVTDLAASKDETPAKAESDVTEEEEETKEELPVPSEAASEEKQSLIDQAKEWGAAFIRRREAAKGFKYERLLNLAYEAESEDDFAKANEYYRTAYKIKKDNEILETIELNNIIYESKKVIKKNPQAFFAYITLGSSYYVKGYFKEAIGIWKQGVEQKPDDPSTLLLLRALLGKGYQVTGKIFESVLEYEAALKLSDIFYIRTSLAHALWEYGELEDALDIWETSFKERPYQIDIATALAKAYAALGMQDDALKTLSQLEEVAISELREQQIYPSEVSPDYYVFSFNKQLLGLFKDLQFYPSEVTPDYFAVNIPLDRAFSNSVYGLAEAYAVSGRGEDAVRWLEIYLGLSSEKDRNKRKEIVLGDPDFAQMDLSFLLTDEGKGHTKTAQNKEAGEPVVTTEAPPASDQAVIQTEK
ncbi:MAG: tetratricopeptide repeat protein [Candidatus Omnitrophica bacterium]|nr:tetratricopeptide repeat protein [Candidatus Omnitrophota bacterium]